MQPHFPQEDVPDLNLRLESREPHDILRWLFLDSGVEAIAVASSFQAEGVCMIHMATSVRPDVPILFLETGFHFAETLGFKQRLTEQMDLNVVELVGEYTVEEQAEGFGDRLYERDPDMCCNINKVVPFARALHGFDAWVTALRRDSSPSRAGTPILEQYELEPGRPMVKVNPIATWTRPQVWAYLKENDLPHNPLYDLGYAQIGCAPCSRTVFAGEPERAGRWDGSQKVECGIHQHAPRAEAGAAGGS